MEDKYHPFGTYETRSYNTFMCLFDLLAALYSNVETFYATYSIYLSFYDRWRKQIVKTNEN